MTEKIVTKYAPITLVVKVKSDKPQKLYFTVYDASNPLRKFTERWKTIQGEETLYVRMPLSPEVSVVDVSNTPNGTLGNKNVGFEIVSVKKAPLERRIDENDIGNAMIRNFVAFAQKFCYNVSELQVNKTYISDDGNFFINLVQTIKNERGVELNTPARIGRRTGTIQVSKSAFVKFTIPMRMAILLHEFSHYYLNEKIDDEMEADLNGLLIYLGLGYPRIEAYQAFLETFKGRPTSLNKARYDLINKFINDFEKMNIVIA
jgi:hypothetical protein